MLILVMMKNCDKLPTHLSSGSGGNRLRKEFMVKDVNSLCALGVIQPLLGLSWW